MANCLISCCAVNALHGKVVMPPYDVSLLNASITTGGIRNCSPSTIALAIMAIGILDKRYLWNNSGVPINDTDWNNLDYQISNALDEMMSLIVGEVIMGTFRNPIPDNLLICNGATYNRVDYPALYDVLHNNYRIDADTFRVPDFRGRFPRGRSSSINMAEEDGRDFASIDIANLPPHTHSYSQYTFGIDIESVGVPDPTGVGQPAIPQNTSSVGGGQDLDIQPRYHALRFFIVAQ